MFVVAKSQLEHLKYYLAQVSARATTIQTALTEDAKTAEADATEVASHVEEVFTHIKNAGTSVETALAKIEAKAKAATTTAATVASTTVGEVKAVGSAVAPVVAKVETALDPKAPAPTDHEAKPTPIAAT